jgi:zinc D-Ala-D-Ala carboxypeptidase
VFRQNSEERGRVPRTKFAINEDCISSSDTYPPSPKGGWFHTLTLFSFLVREARGILHYPAHTWFSHSQLFFTALILLFSNFAFSQTLPGCAYEDVLTTHQSYDDWQRTLLDTIYKLPGTYTPPDLVSVSQAGLAQDYKLRALVIPDLALLVRAAKEADVPLEIQSAYRSYSYQERTFQYWVSKEGYEVALESSARPGHSEHQLGTAVDFRSAGGAAPWDMEDWGQTPTGAWLAEHAWEYGFVMSYPPGKQDITCYIYEPWHYRYVGKEVAKAVKESGLTLREWLWLNQ